MRISVKALLWFSSLAFITVLFLFCCKVSAQTSGSAGTIQGTVTDPSNAVISGAKVEIHNPVSGYLDIRDGWRGQVQHSPTSLSILTISPLTPRDSLHTRRM